MRPCVFPAAFALLMAAPVQAQSASTATPRTDRTLGEHTEAGTPAVAHFEQALTWYRAGKYQRAEQELEAALQSDPSGKDLVFNLALVQEKLGDLAGAIASLDRFMDMEKDPKELDRAVQTKQRLEGARAELLASDASKPAPSVPPKPCPRVLVRGKMDAWVVGSGSLAFASVVLGSVFGLRALTLNRDTEAAAARDSALIAEVAFAASLIAGAGTVALYFGRVSDTPEKHAALPLSFPRFSAARLMIRY